MTVSHAPTSPSLKPAGMSLADAGPSRRAEVVVRMTSPSGRSELLGGCAPRFRNGAPPSAELLCGPVDGFTEVVTATSREIRWWVASSAAGLVELPLEVQGPGGEILRRSHFIPFGGQPSAGSPAERGPGYDGMAPYVVWPPESRGEPVLRLRAGEPLVLELSEPLRPDAVAALTMTGARTVRARLSPDGRRMEVAFDASAGLHQVTLMTTAQDLASTPLDQNPVEVGDQPYDTLVEVMGPARGEESPLASGISRSAAFLGGFAFVSSVNEANRPVVRVLDLRANPLVPTRVTEILVEGIPRDILVLPSYGYVVPRETCLLTELRLSGDLDGLLSGGSGSGGPDSGASRAACRGDGPLLVVMTYQAPRAGVANIGEGAKLQVFDISWVESREVFTVASQAIGISPLSIPSRMEWHPPYISYLEVADDTNYVGALNLQKFLVGDLLTREEVTRLPYDEAEALGTGDDPDISNATGRAGLDQNGDGDYVDPGEVLPLPARPISLSAGVSVLGYLG